MTDADIGLVAAVLMSSILIVLWLYGVVRFVKNISWYEVKDELHERLWFGRRTRTSTDSFRLKVAEVMAEGRQYRCLRLFDILSIVGLPFPATAFILYALILLDAVESRLPVILSSQLAAHAYRFVATGLPVYVAVARRWPFLLRLTCVRIYYAYLVVLSTYFTVIEGGVMTRSQLVTIMMRLGLGAAMADTGVVVILHVLAWIIMGFMWQFDLPTCSGRVLTLHFTVSVMICLVVGAVEHAQECEVRSLLQSKATKRAEDAVDRLLCGMCDAVIHLSEDMHIIDPSPKLASLLLHKSTMQGVLFTEVIPNGEDRVAFRRFLQRPSESFTQTIMTTLKDRNSTTFSVQLFHVSCLDHLDQVIHILGIRDVGEERLDEDTRDDNDSESEHGDAENTRRTMRTCSRDTPTIEEGSEWSGADDDPGPAWDSAAMSSDVAVWLTCDTSFKIIKCTPKFADFIGAAPHYFSTKFLDYVAAKDKLQVTQSFHEAVNEYWSERSPADDDDASPHSRDDPPRQQENQLQFRMWTKTGTCLQVKAKISVFRNLANSSLLAGAEDEADVEECILVRFETWQEKGKKPVKVRALGSQNKQAAAPIEFEPPSISSKLTGLAPVDHVAHGYGPASNQHSLGEGLLAL
mmetsp:Transcript_26629/g.61223  ORF Transcript_26629/g.61223 Transcript_26629/m.61223 type:complete len:634 (+) Transcript_26629:91-1992(+)